MKKKKTPQGTWIGQGKSDQWNEPLNWDGKELPTDTAVFSKSAQTLVTFNNKLMATINTIQFDADAPSYTFIFGVSEKVPTFTIGGEGIQNNSQCVQSFIVAATGQYYRNPMLKFANNASAGSANNIYTSGPTSLEDGFGGGIIGFTDKSTAGAATFIVTTGAIPPPSEGSTVGGEVAFCDNSTAGTANFTIYGTLGPDGDTFGNTVFHDYASADHGMFTNIGGTVSGGDGGNTQLYNYATADHGSFYNFGGSFSKANGGDVAFDGNADGGYAVFHNLQATAVGAYGGVTSFNNNPPVMDAQGATAGHAIYNNYGAREATDGGGGHTEFTAKYGTSSGANGTFNNYGSAVNGKSTAGHTSFSTSPPTNYYPSAGNGTFYNYPALTKDGAGGYTAFAVYGDGSIISNVPTAENGTFLNFGGNQPGVYGGLTSFSGNSSAGNAQLIAFGGTNGGYGGKVVFYDQSIGSMSTIDLIGNGELDISSHTGALTISTLNLNEGILRVKIGAALTSLNLQGKLAITSAQTAFSFVTDDSVKLNQPYALLKVQNMSDFDADQFTGNSFNGVVPQFYIVGEMLFVIFNGV